VTYAFHILSLHDALPICAWRDSLRINLPNMTATMTRIGKILKLSNVSLIDTANNRNTPPVNNMTCRMTSASVVVVVSCICAKSRSEEHTSELQSRENLVC